MQNHNNFKHLFCKTIKMNQFENSEGGRPFLCIENGNWAHRASTHGGIDQTVLSQLTFLFVASGTDGEQAQNFSAHTAHTWVSFDGASKPFKVWCMQFQSARRRYSNDYILICVIFELVLNWWFVEGKNVFNSGE